MVNYALMMVWHLQHWQLGNKRKWAKSTFGRGGECIPRCIFHHAALCDKNKKWSISGPKIDCGGEAGRGKDRRSGLCYFSSSSILCDFSVDINESKCQCGKPARTRGRLESSATKTRTSTKLTSYGHHVRVSIQIRIVFHVLQQMEASFWRIPQFVNVGWKLTIIIKRFVTNADAKKM